MTVDQITAEVESRRESIDVDRESDDWTKLDSVDGGDIDDIESTLVENEDVPNEVSDDDDDDIDGDADDDDNDNDEPGKPAASQAGGCGPRLNNTIPHFLF